jgi:Transposase DDE domain group 1
MVATLSARLGVAAIVNSTLRMGGLIGGAHPGRKVLTLVHAIVAGGSHIDHAEILRAGDTARVLGHRVMAPSTLGTFLRSFTFGHVRQLEAVVGAVLARAWALGAGPGQARLVIDIDSTICEVEGKKKQGAADGYTKVLGYHPILASRADTGEIVHARMRKGSANTARGGRRFIDEVVARLRRAGAAGEMVMRFDSGFWSKDTIATLARHRVDYTMAVRTNTKGVAEAIAAIDETAWTEIAYTPGGQAQVAETEYQGRRLIVRRTRLTNARQARLWPDWRHFAFLTDLHGDAPDIDAFHRAHASVELVIRDLKEGAGLEHCPSGYFSANSAWLQCAVLAHNLILWTATIAEAGPTNRLTVARTVRFQLLAIPGRLVNRSGIPTLRAPARWPWAALFARRLNTIRALPAPG